MDLQPTDKLTGTLGQIEWAEGIKIRIDKEFDRVASAFRGASANQQEQDQLDTLAIIEILEHKRAEVLAIKQAGYFIRVWQDLNDQVRQLIRSDSRYLAIRSRRPTKTQSLPRAESVNGF